MHVIESVPRTGEQRMIDPFLADGIVMNAERNGHEITREWANDVFVVRIMYRYKSGKIMLTYSAPTD